MRRWRRSFALLLVMALGLGGCGVSATDQPVDEGDALTSESSATDYSRLDPPEPDSAQTPLDLVGNFLQASAGGLADANERVKRYLTDVAHARWVDPIDPRNPPLTLVRIVSGPTMGAYDPERGTQVTVEYQEIGTLLTGYGLVDDLASLETRQLTFWVIAEDFKPRIREIEGWPERELLLSDEGLDTYYDVLPIYFWDKNYQTLVPDLRYVPNTINPDQRYGERLKWLAAGPSPWLAPGVQNLPAGTSPEPVVTTEDTLQVSLSTATPLEPDEVRRLLFQLQWSLSESRLMPQVDIDLRIGGQPVTPDAPDDAFRDFLYSFSHRGEPHRYQIRDGVVQAVGATPIPAVLSAQENASVTTAAISADQRVAAFVSDDGFSGHSLYVVRNGQPTIDVAVPTVNQLGRPSFVPGTDLLLVPTGGADGKLLSISTVDGTVVDASRPIGITTAAVSPDGRRVAYIAEGEVYVVPLVISDNSVTLGSAPRQLLAGQLTATAITWTSESWLVVAGTRGDEPALWRVTADGATARNFSDRSVGVRVADLVCFPNWARTRDGDAEVLAVTDEGTVYTFFNNQFSPETTLAAPFYGG